jgi:sugar lactone lactonase YvrE
MSSPRFRCLVLAALMAALVGLAEGQPDSAKWEVLNKDGTGRFIVALTQDLSGNIWVGTEDKGVFRYDPKADKWTQFNSKNGLADDNAYAITVDRHNRVWVGTLNKGVSVFNGAEWKNYDVLDGPIGERIFAITTCPTDGDVWMATSAGLTRYSLKGETWSYYTSADGLPEDQANSISFDPQGNVYVGTQCYGIAMAKAADDYKKWTVVSGPVQPPLTPNGSGLPTSLINGLLVSREGTIFAATTTGLAWSKDKGKTWSYQRGKDYAAKVKGRWGGAPASWKEAPKTIVDTLLPEDYVTCLAEDDTGLLWLGFRQQGYVTVDPKTGKHVFAGSKKVDGLPDDYVFTILPTTDKRPCVGTYGGGFGQAKSATKRPGAKSDSAQHRQPEGSQGSPVPAESATLTELKNRTATVEKISVTKQIAHLLSDDWRTQGNFYGEDPLENPRYGEGFGVLCAHSSPNDAVVGARPLNVKAMQLSFGASGRLGSHAASNDGLRHWVHWARTDNPRCLKNPYQGARRQAEWDDHKEVYPLTHEGPGIYIDLELPKGAWYVSFYFMNKDGHEGNNRWRDYLLTLKPICKTEAEFAQAPTLSRSRVRDFWGGVYKRFVVAGDRKYTLQIHPNWSFNTIVSGVFFDPVIDPPDGKWGGDPFNLPIPRILKAINAVDAGGLRNYWRGKESDANYGVVTTFGSLEQWRFKDPVGWATHARRDYLVLLRTMEKDLKPSGMWPEVWERVKAECCNQVRLFERRDELYARKPVIPSTKLILDGQRPSQEREDK